MRLRWCVLVFGFLWVPAAQAECVDLPNMFLMYAPKKGPSSWISTLSRDPVVVIRLDCALTDDEWAKLPLASHVCTGAKLQSPSGGKCNLIELIPMADKPDGWDTGTNAEYIIRRKVSD